MVSSVRVSPMPGKTTFDPNNEKKPSASRPHRATPWDRSCRQASVRTPWLPPSATSIGRSCRGAMFASSSRANSIGAPTGRPAASAAARFSYAAVRSSRSTPATTGAA